MKTEFEVRSRERERGAVSLKAVFLLSIAGALIFTLVKFVPVYVEQKQLMHEVDELARTAAVRNWNDDRIALDVKRLRTDYSLPDNSINFVSKDRHVQVVIGYKRDIDLLVTNYVWQVDYTANGKEL